MKEIYVAAATIFAASAAFADTINFDADAPGQLPAGWAAGRHRRGAAKWAVLQEASAPSKPNVLRQIGVAKLSLGGAAAIPRSENGFVEVKFRSLSARKTRPAASSGAGRTATTTTSRAPTRSRTTCRSTTRRAGGASPSSTWMPRCRRNVWHTLRVEFSGERISVALDGKTYIDLEDAHISGPGARRALDQGRQRHRLRRLQLRLAQVMQRILIGRALRGFADGFIAVVLPALSARAWARRARGRDHQYRDAARLRVHHARGRPLGAPFLDSPPDARRGAADGRDRPRLRRLLVVLAAARRRRGRHAQPQQRRRERLHAARPHDARHRGRPYRGVLALHVLRLHCRGARRARIRPAGMVAASRCGECSFSTQALASWSGCSTSGCPTRRPERTSRQCRSVPRVASSGGSPRCSASTRSPAAWC